MTIFQSIILGIIQGLTEFIPISSSGHLVLVKHLLGWEISPAAAFVFDVMVQVATLVAVFYITRPPGLEPHKSIGDLEILASSDHLDLYANLDFYDWLAKEKEHGG